LLFTVLDRLVIDVASEALFVLTVVFRLVILDANEELPLVT
jgi:hypothetical protein